MTVQPDSVAGVSFDALETWMSEHELGDGPITEVQQLTGGTQNILLSFMRSDRQYVLRRPPVNKRKNSDETMRREARVLQALRGTDVPHPALIAACADTDVIGAAFYLMEPVNGIATLPLPEQIAHEPAQQRRLGESMVDALAAIGRVDHLERGLGGFGRADGWLERQVLRWRSQLDSYRDVEHYPGPQLPQLEHVATWLEQRIPGTWQPGLLHGDYHYGNVMIRRDDAAIAAVVDWELSTIGDPLLDVGHLLANWPEPEHKGRLGVPDAPGMASPTEVVERYARESGRDVTHIKWFAVLACYRLGILLEGSNARAYAGATTREIGDMLGSRAKELFEQASELISSSDLD